MADDTSATLRHADPQRDGAACAAIFAPFVAGSAVSFEEKMPDAASFTERISTLTRSYPWLVLEREGRVIAYACASSHRPRAAYRWAAEVGIYVDPVHHRAGVGRRLYAALFELLRRQRLQIACAAITLPNDASIGLHRALGFEPAGVQRAIGYKRGAWHDVSWWQLRLNSDDDGGPPQEPLDPQRLPD